LREKLGIPTDRKVALYAPTFRERQGKRRRFKMPLDLDAMQTALGEEYFLLVRTHYLDAYRLRDRNRSFAADVSGHHDVSELMLLTDVLVTDYSSLMFDFANLRRPMIFFAYDYDDYASNDRGVYFDLIEVAPGPVVTDSDAVTEALADLSWHHRDYIGRYNEFVRRFCEYDTGKASESVVEQVLRRR
jgi:CDP-glycerol glycerophosphotransferase